MLFTYAKIQHRERVFPFMEGFGSLFANKGEYGEIIDSFCFVISLFFTIFAW